jgi:hypothetical protein
MKKYTHTKSSYHSSFWYDEHDFDENIVYSSISESAVDTIKKYRLSSARKAISNFVSIATGKNIPVRFETKNSFTDGESVTISGDVDSPEKFDVGVGLALHEGSHILLSDFKLLHRMGSLIPQELKDKALTKNVNQWEIGDHIKNLCNIVEDRRIDNFIYTKAPGYREYYLKLYDFYFNDKIVDKALKDGEYTNEDIESYMFRLINLVNANTTLGALKGLRKIYGMIDLKNIGRLKSTKEVLDLCFEIYDVILDNIEVQEAGGNKTQEGQQGESGEGGEEGDGNAQNMEGDSTEENNGGNGMSSSAEGGEQMDGSDDGSGNEGESGDGKESDKESDGSNGSNKKPSNLSANQQRQLNKAIKKQKDFLDNKIKKKTITKQLESEISSVDSQGAEITHVADNFTNGHGKNKGVDVIIIKNLTKQMMESDTFHMAWCSTNWKTNKRELKRIISESDFNQAETMGTVMGKKLQVRNESRETIFNRQKNGKIDGRMVASLGFDYENVFTQTFVDKFKKANIHLSIDASGSMGGQKWKQTMINAIALAKAVSMIGNLELQITFRYSDANLPVILFAYDSRKDSFQKIKSLFPFLKETGTTPEGLTFEAIQKLLVSSTNDLDSYFVNISDGEPCFSNSDIQYTGHYAAEHTKKEVNKIRERGIGVLSYFVTDYGDGGSSRDRFRAMYGADSKFININSISEVTATLNKMFLTK